MPGRPRGNIGGTELIFPNQKAARRRPLPLRHRAKFNASIIATAATANATNATNITPALDGGFSFSAAQWFVRIDGYEHVAFIANLRSLFRTSHFP